MEGLTTEEEVLGTETLEEIIVGGSVTVVSRINWLHLGGGGGMGPEVGDGSVPDPEEGEMLDESLCICGMGEPLEAIE